MKRIPNTGLCKVPKCLKNATSLRMCSSHYMRFHRYGDPLISKRIRGRVGCTIGGCLKSHYSLGFCQLHYERKMRNGSPTFYYHDEKNKGQSNSRTYRRWILMRDRCGDDFDKYDDYAGRGITVCDRWLESFTNFYEDMGECPKGMTLDRRENDRGYCKENCRWATMKTQSRNRRTNVLLEHNGIKKCVSDWAEFIGIKVTTLRERIKYGWSVDRALNIPTRLKAGREYFDDEAPVNPNLIDDFEMGLQNDR